MRYLLFILSSFLVIHASAQTGSYPGTWHYQNGDQLFIVKLWQDDNTILGHYKMIKVDANGNQVAVIYTSRKVYSNGLIIPYTIYSGTGSKLAGPFHDNTNANNPDEFKDGRFEMKMNQFIPGCSSCIVTSSWKVTDTADLYVGDYFPFSVPTDVTLTKMSDTITLD